MSIDPDWNKAPGLTTFSSVQEMRELLTAADWPYVAVTTPGEDGTPVETGFRLLLCPKCWAAVPPDLPPYLSRTNHIADHCADLERVIIASAGIGVGLTIGRDDG